MTRCFVEGIHAVGDEVPLAPDDARKLVTVLRAASGERIEIVDSAGRAFVATLAVDGRAVSARLDAGVARAQRRGEAAIDLAQAIPKGAKMDFVIEKATELGVRTIVPLRSERVIGERTGDRKHERWQRLARTAAQQCGRTTIPAVREIAGWESVLASFAAYDRVFVPWELADARPLRETFERLGALASILLVIGPEGGFSADEAERAHGAGAALISLGSRILRTETAALVTMSALRYALGEL